MLYTIGVNASLYVLVALISSILHARTLLRILFLPLLSGLLGVIFALALGAVPTLLLAALYRSVPSVMSPIEAVAIGCGQGLVIAMLNAGFFHRIL
eukprot:GO255439.1.p3 GENE.GO255439.1~~GO255439.1.p3  ORF type:complete len:109 (+),score=20.01 GO255439.1:42-329(+)